MTCSTKVFDPFGSSLATPEDGSVQSKSSTQKSSTSNTPPQNPSSAATGGHESRASIFELGGEPLGEAARKMSANRPIGSGSVASSANDVAEHGGAKQDHPGSSIATSQRLSHFAPVSTSGSSGLYMASGGANSNYHSKDINDLAARSANPLSSSGGVNSNGTIEFQSQPSSPNAFGRATFNDLAALVQSVPASRRNSQELKGIWKEFGSMSISERKEGQQHPGLSPKLPHGLLDDDFSGNDPKRQISELYLNKPLRASHNASGIMSPTEFDRQQSGSLFSPDGGFSTTGAHMSSLNNGGGSNRNSIVHSNQYLGYAGHRDPLLISPMEDFTQDIHGFAPARGSGLVRNSSTPALSAKQQAMLHSFDELASLHGRANGSGFALDDYNVIPPMSAGSSQLDLASAGAGGFINEQAMLSAGGGRFVNNGMMQFGPQALGTAVRAHPPGFNYPPQLHNTLHISQQQSQHSSRHQLHNGSIVNASNGGTGTNTPNGGGGGNGSHHHHYHHHHHHHGKHHAKSHRKGDNEANRFADVPLESLEGKIFAVCKDQHGCRYLQKNLEEGRPELIEIIFKEVTPHFTVLMTDPFGNYLCQKLLEHCNESQRTHIVTKITPDLVNISLNMHGTRAVQKMIEYLSNQTQIDAIIEAFRNSVVLLIRDLNGNHVIQKCLNRLSSKDNQFIYDSVAKNCIEVATHRHGCCVFQRCIDHASDYQKRQLVLEVVENALALVQDPFGNYVVQYILDLNCTDFSEPLINRFVDQICGLSVQKFSSNVMEKCIRLAKPQTRRKLISPLVHPGKLDTLMRDSYGNYVVQTSLDYADPQQRTEMIEHIMPILPSIRHTPYGKRICSKLQRDGYMSGAVSNNVSRHTSPTLAPTSSSVLMQGGNGPYGYQGRPVINGGHAQGVALSPHIGGLPALSSLMSPHQLPPPQQQIQNNGQNSSHIRRSSALSPANRGAHPLDVAQQLQKGHPGAHGSSAFLPSFSSTEEQMKSNHPSLAYQGYQ
ncbi:hypothetical protein H4219_001198 [Mycoemilia scoparia]|uniref:PUM-HD domain-containing protein n=1 Tax=Mycoemilia scoparia TaxID=417184 RepID=A0A9W8DVP9_9FUNG|nr:hypothetical protein H4219_001198 [Mycoemilia scoparia]